MKKYFIVLVVLLLIACMVAGCQNAQTGTSSTPSASATTSTSVASPSAASASQPSPSATVSKKPLEGKHLIWANLAGYVPFRYFEDQKNGTTKLVGFEVDVVDEIAKKLGFTWELADTPFASVIANINSGRADFGMNHVYTEERDKSVDFTSTGYFNGMIGVLCTKDADFSTYDKLAGKTVAATLGSLHQTFAEGIPNAKVIVTEGTNGIQEVISGRADAYFTDGAEAKAAAEKNNLSSYILPKDKDTEKYVREYKMVFNEGSELTALFDKCLKEMREDGTLNKLLTKWLGAEFQLDQ